MAEKKKERYKMPGEYYFEGLLLNKFWPYEVVNKAKTFPFNETDVVVATFPKCGTTWTQEIAWLVMHDGDTEGAKAKDLEHRVPFLEVIWLGEHDESSTTNIDNLAAAPPPRLIKTHLPVKFFEPPLEKKTARFIVVIRNPKDAFVSYYHLYRQCEVFGCYTGTWDEFFEDMVRDDHMAYGSWWDYQLGWWKYKDHPNVLILKFEDMVRDLDTQVRAVAKFLGKDLSDETLQRITHHTTFGQMKKNDMVNKSRNIAFNNDISPFMRKGTIGDWKNYFSKEQSDYIDKKMEKLIGTGLTVDFE